MLRLLPLLLTLGLLFAGSSYEDDPQKDQYTKLRGGYTASHILVAYQLAARASEEVTRTKPEAEAHAKELLEQIKADPSQFEKLAREESDGTTAGRSGYLGVSNYGNFDQTFERAIKRLSPGEVASRPIETDFGFHIIRREHMWVKNYSARVLVITFRGATYIEGIPYRRPNREQSKEDAEAMIEKLKPSVTLANWDEMVETYSDFRKPGGFFGNFQRYDTVSAMILSELLEDMAYDDISDVVELPFGYALVRRVKVEKINAARILIKHKEVEDAPKWMTRPKDDARFLAEDLLKQLKKKPKNFAKLAKKHSEGLYKGRGGVLPSWLKGDKYPEMEAVLPSMQADAIYPELLDTSEGFVIVQKLAEVNE